jgi:pyrimidine operon attenuation protein/uracil phosphoribosyltransferase
MKKQIMSAEDIGRSINRIAMQIVENNHGVANIAIIGIHTGGVFLADRIQKIIQEQEKMTVPAGSLDITLYRDDWSLVTQNPVVKKTDIDFSVEDMVVVLVDDVIFTGRTIRAALDALMDIGRPRCIQLATLVDRGNRELPIQSDYVGLDVQVAENEHIHVRLAESGGRDEIILETR